LPVSHCETSVLGMFSQGCVRIITTITFHGTPTGCRPLTPRQDRERYRHAVRSVSDSGGLRDDGSRRRAPACARFTVHGVFMLLDGVQQHLYSPRAGRDAQDRSGNRGGIDCAGRSRSANAACHCAPRERPNRGRYCGTDPALKNALIRHRSTKFFVVRTPSWQQKRIRRDAFGQRLNGVLKVSRTTRDDYPVWSAINPAAYADYLAGNKARANELTTQIVDILYTVRNNTFHGGKMPSDANDRGLSRRRTHCFT
jgi:hypothetical protein